MGAVGAVTLTHLAGCGFALRRPARLKLQTLSLQGFATRSPLGEELKRAVEASGTTRVVDAQGQARLVSLVDAREQVAAASTTAGQVRELTLRRRFRFKVDWADGRVAIPETELVLSRDLSFDETLALAKEQEAEALIRSMQSDIVAQVLRRLATLQPQE